MTGKHQILMKLNKKTKHLILEIKRKYCPTLYDAKTVRRWIQNGKFGTEFFSENFGPSLWSTLMEAITVQVFYILRKHCLLKIHTNEYLVELVPA